MSYLDSRDLIKRREELESERDSFTIQDDFAGEVLSPDVWAVENPEAAEELAELVALCEECEGYGDWEYGETLIPEDDFTDYIRELLIDCGTLPRDLPEWVEINWDATAENCKCDYMEVDFRGTTYLMRA